MAHVNLPTCIVGGYAVAHDGGGAGMLLKGVSWLKHGKMAGREKWLVAASLVR